MAKKNESERSEFKEKNEEKTEKKTFKIIYIHCSYYCDEAAK